MPRPIGRPTAYKKKYCQLLIDHMKQGLSFESFGGVAEVSKQTLYDWMQKHGEFLDARRKGDTLSLLQWEKMGIAGMTAKIKFFNGHIWALNMKARFRWSDRMEIEQNSRVKVEMPDDVSTLSDTELSQRYKNLMDNES